MATSILFTPSATETCNITGPASQTFAMPAVDASNTDVVLTNTGPTIITGQFGTTQSLNAVSTVSFVLSPGQQILFTSPAIAAASPNNPAVVSTGGQASVAGSATYIAMMPQSGFGQGSATVQRGTASTQVAF